MGKIINITDKLSNEKPTLTIGDKSYTINDSMDSVFKFEELASTGNSGVMKAMEGCLGKKAMDEIGVKTMSVGNFKVLTIAVLAAMQGIEYEDAEARFLKQLNIN